MTIDQKLREFVGEIARMSRLGDLSIDENGVEYPYQPDGCSDEDAQALYALIDEARALQDAVFSEYLEQADLERYRVAAKEEHEREGEVEIDPGAVVSVSEDGGAYVAGWLWVEDEAAGVNREAEEDE